MKNGRPEYALVRNDLLVRKASDEVIVYNRNNQRAYCLNGIAVSVWQLCEAHKSAREICDMLGQENEELVSTILTELHNSGLLTNDIPLIADKNLLSRRDLVKKVGAGIALAAPFVTSIVVPPPAAAVSPPRRPERRYRRKR